ncbi:hypothetical protein GCM10009557_29810 [Virgisporangium ochraceum]
MVTLARVVLDDGSSILVEAPVPAGGPVKAGRLGDTIRDLPSTLGTALGPVASMARTVLNQLRQAGPDELQVEFGVELATESGVVITRAQATCHLQVTMTWRLAVSG